MSIASGVAALTGAPAIAASFADAGSKGVRAEYSHRRPLGGGMGAGSFDLGLDDEDAEDSAPDRDSRSVRGASARGAGRERLAVDLPGRREAAWGGALRRMSESGPLAPSREDENRLTSVASRYVPIGFARYTSPVVDPYDYEYYRVAGWRVAVPRSTPGERVRDLLYRIFYYGPQSAGYARIGDCLVPGILGPGDRATLAQSSVEYYAEPLGE